MNTVQNAPGLHRNTWGILKLDHKTGEDASSVVSPFVSTSCLMNTVQCGVLLATQFSEMYAVEQLSM